MNTLAERLSAFINAEGHITSTDTSEHGTTVHFRTRGLGYQAQTTDGDDAYLQLSCAMMLESGVVFDVSLLRALLQCQDHYKCVKLSLQRDDALFVCSVEFFFPRPDGYETTFWRSVAVIETALYAGLSEIRNHSTKLAAERFIEELSAGNSQ